MRTIASLSLALALLTAPACARLRSSAPPGPEPKTTVRVDNQSFLDMNVYVWRSSQRLRLGFVNGHSAQTFELPRGLLFGATPLRFQADPVGGSRTPISEEIVVSPGDEVVLQIPPQ